MSEHTDKDVIVAKSAGMIVGTGLRKKHPWRFAALIAGVAVGALLVGAGVRWLQQYQTNRSAASASSVTAKTEHAQDLAASGDYAAALKEISAALKNPQLADDQKYSLYFQQGVTYENQKNYTAAEAAYKKADTIKPTKATAAAIARVAAAAGDKTTAIAYYQKAIARISASSPIAAVTKDKYKQAIADLEAQP